jgi:hypothetical protein
MDIQCDAGLSTLNNIRLDNPLAILKLDAQINKIKAIYTNREIQYTFIYFLLFDKNR